MAKRRRKRRSSARGNTRRCKNVKAVTSSKFDKVKIGSRFYRAKGKVMDVHPNGRVTVCPVGRSHKMLTGDGKLVALYKVAKKRR